MKMGSGDAVRDRICERKSESLIAAKGAHPIAISDIVYQSGLQQGSPFDFGSKKAYVCPKKCVRSMMALFLIEPLKNGWAAQFFSVFNSADLARAKSQFPKLFISIGCKNLATTYGFHRRRQQQ